LAPTICAAHRRQEGDLRAARVLCAQPDRVSLLPLLTRRQVLGLVLDLGGHLRFKHNDHSLLADLAQFAQVALQPVHVADGA